mgnify:FL=1
MGKRILLADDNPVNAEVTTVLLQQLGYEVECGYDGEEAVEIAEEEGPFDIVILDCKMPVLDGYEACEKIRALPGYKETPIIALSGNDSEDHEARANEVGMNDFLVKPVLLETLKTMMNKWLEPDV